MKIAILGNGVSGLSAAVVLSNNPYIKKIDIISDSINSPGGEYIKGGLKYIYDTPDTENFLEQLNLYYEKKKINGALLYEDNIHFYPECMYKFSKSKSLGIQQKYWDKTRGASAANNNIDYRCMNSPWNNDNNNDISLNIIGGTYVFIKTIVDFLNECPIVNYIQTNVDENSVKNILKEYDHIIYTIPFSIFSESILNKKLDLKFKKLFIARFIVDRWVSGNIWWDYLYNISEEYSFHRISCMPIGATDHLLDLEFNNDQSNYENMLIDFIKRYIYKNFSSVNYTPDFVGDISIKGQISNDLYRSNIRISEIEDEYPNISFIGRYAEFDKKITFNKVIKKIYMINNKIKGIV